MSVKYKKNGTWYDISSSSNNAVDTVADGNMNPVTSNAVYDALLAKANVATWIPNGSNPLTLNTGLFAYSTNPNNVPSQGIPSGLSAYGTLIGVGSGTNYKTMLYISVLGGMAIWASNSQSWKIVKTE